jgi:hypothetical protein
MKHMPIKAFILNASCSWPLSSNTEHTSLNFINSFSACCIIIGKENDDALETRCLEFHKLKAYCSMPYRNQGTGCQTPDTQVKT